MDTMTAMKRASAQMEHACVNQAGKGILIVQVTLSQNVTTTKEIIITKKNHKNNYQFIYLYEMIELLALHDP